MLKLTKIIIVYQHEECDQRIVQVYAALSRSSNLPT